MHNHLGRLVMEMKLKTTMILPNPTSKCLNRRLFYAKIACQCSRRKTESATVIDHYMSAYQYRRITGYMNIYPHQTRLP